MRDRERKAARDCQKLLKNASKSCKRQPNKEDGEDDNENWIQDGESTHSASPKQTPPIVHDERHRNPRDGPSSSALFPEPETLSEIRLQQFRDTFTVCTWLLGKEKTCRVVRQIHKWNENTGLYFSDEQAVYALQDLERRGKIRLHGDMIYFPEAFHIIPVEVERTDESGGVTHTSNVLRD